MGHVTHLVAMLRRWRTITLIVVQRSLERRAQRERALVPEQASTGGLGSDRHVMPKALQQSSDRVPGNVREPPRHRVDDG